MTGQLFAKYMFCEVLSGIFQDFSAFNALKCVFIVIVIALTRYLIRLI